MLSNKNPLTRAADGSLVEFEPDAIKFSTYRALAAARADLGVDITTMSARFNASGGPLSARDRQRLATLRQLQEHVNLEMDARKAEDDEARSAPDPGSPNADAYYSALAARKAGLDVGGHNSTIQRPRGRKFADLFPAATSMQGWKSAHEFVKCIALGNNDERLTTIQAATYQGGDSSGGYSIPGPILQRWLDLALEDEIVRPRAINWPITPGREISVPAWDAGDRSDGSIGGLEINWETEDPPADADLQVAKTRLITLHARRGAIYCEVTNELLEDGLNFEQQLNMIMGKALSYGLDKSFLSGIGAPEPLGVLNSSALISVTRNTASEIIWDDVADMFKRLSPASFKNAVWITHTSCLPALMKLSIPVGTGGGLAPQVLTERGGKYSMFGLETLFTEKAQPLGTLGDLMLADFSNYYVGIKNDARMDRSGHIGFRRNKTVFRLQVRIDGMPTLSAPETPPNSADTTSPFIVLAA